MRKVSRTLNLVLCVTVTRAIKLTVILVLSVLLSITTTQSASFESNCTVIDVSGGTNTSSTSNISITPNLVFLDGGQRSSLYVCENGWATPELPDKSSNGIQYAWMPADGIADVHLPNPIIQATTNRVYTRQQFLNGMTIGNDTIQVYVRSRETVVFAAIDSVCENIPIIYGVVADHIEQQQFIWNASTAAGTVQGRIVSGQESNIITVMWSGQGSGRIQLRIIYPQSGCEAQGQSVVNVRHVSKPTIQASSLVLCPQHHVILRAESGYARYLWSTKATTEFIEVNEPGEYSVEVFSNDGCSQRSDPTMIRTSTIRKPDIVGPSSLCEGQEAELRLAGSYASCQWSTGATTQSIIVYSPGEYSVWVSSDEGCVEQSETFVVMDRRARITVTMVDSIMARTGTFQVGTLRLCNNGSETIRLTDIQVDATHFSFSEAQKYLPLELSSRACFDLPYRLAISESGSFHATLRVVATSPCVQVDSVSIEIPVRPEPPHVSLVADNVELVECGSTFTFPIHVQWGSEMVQRCSAAQLHMLLRWDASVFTLTGMSGAENISSRRDGLVEERRIVLPRVIMGGNNSSTVVLEAMALVGGRQQTSVNIDSVWWTDCTEIIKTTIQNGSVTLRQHCFPSPITLVSNVAQPMTVQPNPVRSTCVARCKTSQDGRYNFVCMSSTGQIVRQWSMESHKGAQIESDIELSEVADGMYVLYVSGPTERFSQLVAVVH